MTAGLFGSLYSSVSGMNANSNYLAMIADNIANVNTIGYKASHPSFSSLVTTSGSSGIYSSGGVNTISVQTVDESGGQMATGKFMNMAVNNGKGMIPINSETSGLGENLYTRKGDFEQDSNGNFVNKSGFTLMGWPLDNEGRLPGQVGNLNTTPSSLLQSLVPINVRNLNGSATGTTKISVSGNLKESQNIYPGIGEKIKFPENSVANKVDNIGISADEVIIPEIAGNYGMQVGDILTIEPIIENVAYNYTYGGMIQSYSPTPLAPIYGSSNYSLPFTAAPIVDGQNFTISLTPAVSTSVSKTTPLTFTFRPIQPDTSRGEFNSYASLEQAINLTGSNLLTARQYNNSLWLAPIDATQGMSITDNLGSIAANLGLASTSASSNRFATLKGLSDLINNSAGLDAKVDNISSEGVVNFNVIDPLSKMKVTATHQHILNNAAFRTGAATSSNIIVTSPGHGLSVGSYVNFDNITISPLDGVTFGDGTYQVTATTGNTYTITGTGTATLGGVVGGTGGSIIIKDGLRDVAAFTTVSGSADVQVTQPNHGYADGDIIKFNNLAGSPFNGVTINNDEAYIIKVNPGFPNIYTITGSGNATSSANANVGINASVNPYSRILRQLNLKENDKALGPAYDPEGDIAGNMSDKIINAQSSMDTQIFDSFGSPHNIKIGYLKIAPNNWAVEVWVNDPTEIINTKVSKAQLASGTLSFNGDGTLKSVSNSLLNPVTVNWSNQALPSSILFNWGTAGLPAMAKGATIGKNDGLGQLDTDFSTKFIDQNGYAPSSVKTIQIDEHGFIIANFTTGDNKRIFQIPLIEFANVNGLEARTGNAYAETYKSGIHNLRIANSTIGTFSDQHLEQANVEISGELTNMIVAQHAYQANTKVIEVVNELLDTLNRTI